jgi:hypothetical protein
MADSAHRLAVQAAQQLGQDQEAARREAMSAVDDSDPGIELDAVGADDLAALGMSADTELPRYGELRDMRAGYRPGVRPVSPNIGSE